MANEILALEKRGARQHVLFLFPVAAPIQIGGVNVVPTPATRDAVSVLPPIAETIFTAQEKTDLDNGDLVFESISFRPVDGMTGPQVLAKVQALYATRLARFNATYADRYGFAGNRYDA